jgi:hypothetical protein
VLALCSSQVLALYASGRLVRVFADAREGQGSQMLALYSSGRLMRVFADAREGAGAVRC